ncbi:MAG: hypothetical protein HC774_00195 [Sphingomonadales bacterium]|nr:hypothetical protein [Sphingomonadales bacterium]
MLFLCSAQAGYMTGQLVNVDGGFSVGKQPVKRVQRPLRGACVILEEMLDFLGFGPRPVAKRH